MFRRRPDAASVVLGRNSLMVYKLVGVKAGRCKGCLVQKPVGARASGVKAAIFPIRPPSRLHILLPHPLREITNHNFSRVCATFRSAATAKTSYYAGGPLRGTKIANRKVSLGRSSFRVRLLHLAIFLGFAAGIKKLEISRRERKAEKRRQEKRT